MATGTGKDSGPETTCAAGFAGEKRKADGKGEVSFERGIHSYRAADDASFAAANGRCKEDNNGDN